MAAVGVGVRGANGPPIQYCTQVLYQGKAHSGPPLPSSMRCQAVGLILAELTGREAGFSKP